MSTDKSVHMSRLEKATRKEAQEVFEAVTRSCAEDGPDYPVETIQGFLVRFAQRERKRALREKDAEINILRDQITIERKSKASCASCGLLWPNHGEDCGLWVSRDEVVSLERELDETQNKLIRAVHARENLRDEKDAELAAAKNNFETASVYMNEVGRVKQQLEEAHKENEEQARLLGKYGSREAALLGKVDSLQQTINHLVDKLSRVRDFFKFQANSQGGIVEEIDSVLGRSGVHSPGRCSS